MTRQQADDNAKLASLSSREREVLTYLARELTAYHAAAVLGVSASLVAAHRENLYQKLDVSDADGLKMFAGCVGLVQP